MKRQFPSPIRCEEGDAKLGKDGTDCGAGWCCAKLLNVAAGPATPTLVLRRLRTTTNKGPPSPRTRQFHHRQQHHIELMWEGKRVGGPVSLPVGGDYMEH